LASCLAYSVTVARADIVHRAQRPRVEHERPIGPAPPRPEHLLRHLHRQKCTVAQTSGRSAYCDFVIGCMQPWAPSCMRVPVTSSQTDLCFQDFDSFFQDLIYFCFDSFDVSIFRS
jgi:hypothetical protein